jgi:hypothetical protein
MQRRDVVQELQNALHDDMRPGTADSNVNTYELPVTVKRGLLSLALHEIKRLRANG